MTAEIGILNTSAVALAADSAVTIPNPLGQKIYNSANKLFALSKYHPVGIMLFGNATFMGIPWETIIKVYRSNLKAKRFKTLKEYVDDFISFMTNSGSKFIPPAQQDSYVKYQVTKYFQIIKDEIITALEIKNKKNEIINESTLKIITEEIISKKLSEIQKSPLLNSISNENLTAFLSKFDLEINSITKNVFENLPLANNIIDFLKNIAQGLFFRLDNFTNNADGIVFAGFGDEEIFPSIYTYRFECIFQNILKYAEIGSNSINFSSTKSLIIPFAQREMVDTFICGRDPSFKQLSLAYLTEIFEKYPDTILNEIPIQDGVDKNTLLKKLKDASQNLLKNYIDITTQYEQEKHISPILNIVSILPKDELASMAETLVNLTSFKRRITMDAETVGGPIDVAVISKGDGFIWIKRKHYFKPELNPHFFKNYFKERDEDENE